MKQLTFGNTGLKIPVAVFDNPVELGTKLAEEILSKITAEKNLRRPFLLGCPGGRSLQSTYLVLGEMARHLNTDLSNLIFVMLNDYVLKTAEGFQYYPSNAFYSFHRFAYENILKVINEALPRHLHIPKSNVWFADPNNPSSYDVQIEKAGGINMLLLASGASDGQVAFNPPGSTLNSFTRIVEIAETTRKDILKAFPEFKNINEVPSYGVSIGPKTITQLSVEVILVIHGENKQYAVKRLSEYNDFTPEWPASIIFRCNKARIFLDKAAAGKINK